MTTGVVDSERLVAWVRATTAAQGLPERVSEPVAVAAVGVLLRSGTPGRGAHGAAAPSTTAGGWSSHAPVWDDPLNVEAGPSGHGRGQDRRAG